MGVQQSNIELPEQAESEEKHLITQTSHETMQKQQKWEHITYNKCCHGRCDGNVLFLMIGFVLIFYPWLVTVLSPNETKAKQNVSVFYFVLYLIMANVSGIFCIFCFVWYFIKVYTFKEFNYGKHINNNDNELNIKHIVQILWYNEPIAIIEETIDYIKNSKFMQTSHKIIIVIAFEERSAEIERKKQYILEKYDEYFLNIIFTIHPSTLPNNTRGACSNVAWSTKEVYKYLQNTEGNSFNDKEYIFTKFDSDTLVHPLYLASLEYNYLNKMRTNHGICDTIFVPKLSYEYSLNDRWWFVRVMGRFRMLYWNYLNFLNLMIMTVYSVPLNLHCKGGFQCPFNLSEDTVIYIKYSIFSGRAIKIQIIPHYIVLGPTSGDTLKQEIAEFGKQCYRWSIGQAQIIGILIKYTFMCDLSLRNIVTLFMYNMLLLVPYLWQNSFNIFMCVSHSIHMSYYYGAKGFTDAGIHVFAIISLTWLVLLAATPRYLITHGMIYLSKKRQKSTLKPFCWTLLEMIGYMIPVAIVNLYSVKSYFDALIYGQSVYTHTVGDKRALALYTEET